MPSSVAVSAAGLVVGSGALTVVGMWAIVNRVI